MQDIYVRLHIPAIVNRTVSIGGQIHDSIPRADTSMEKLARLPPAFDRTSGEGTLTAGNSSPLTDGAASVWMATGIGFRRLPDETPYPTRRALVPVGVIEHRYDRPMDPASRIWLDRVSGFPQEMWTFRVE